MEMWIGMLASTCFTKTSLLEKERFLAFQPDYLSLMAAKKGTKCDLRGQPLRRGAPKYLVGRSDMGIGRIDLIILRDLWLHFPKKMRLLLKLNV